MTTITYTANAYAPEWQDIGEIVSGKAAPLTTIHDADCLSESDTYLGKATITLELVSMEQITAAQIKRLESMLETVRAENQKRENALLDRISKLTAIGYTEAA